MIEYQCQQCHTVYDLPEKQSNGVARRKHACTKCNDITTFEKIDHDLSDMNDVKRDYLRSVNPEVRVTKGQPVGTLHINDDGNTLCNTDAETRKVDIEIYPPGYADWCTHCRQVASGKTSPKAGQDTPKESCIKAIQQAQERVDGTISKAKYRDVGMTPSLYTITKKFGTWSEAKREALE